jgi:hypothetical protein
MRQDAAATFSFYTMRQDAAATLSFYTMGQDAALREQMEINTEGKEGREAGFGSHSKYQITRCAGPVSINQDGNASISSGDATTWNFFGFV